jgi:hypothetical protein
MSERQGAGLPRPPDHEGFILLDAEGYVVATSLKGQECLVFLAGIGVGERLTHLGQRSLQELIALLSTSKMEQCLEVVLTEPHGQEFAVIIQPVLTEEFKGWILVIRRSTKGSRNRPFLSLRNDPR